MTDQKQGQDAPETIWFAPNDGDLNGKGWAGVCSGEDKLYWETSAAHHPDDNEIPYTRKDIADARIAELEGELVGPKIDRNGIAIFKVRAKARNDALDEAAKLCGHNWFAKDIRALKSPTQENE